MQQEHGIELSIKATKAKIGAQEYDRASKTVVAGAAKAKGAVAAANTAIAGTAVATKTASAALLTLSAGYAQAVAVAYAIYRLIAPAARFEQSMKSLEAVATANVDSATEQVRVMGLLENKAKELGASTSFTAAQVVQAEEALTRGGFAPQQTLQAIAHVLNLAKTESLDLARAATITGDVLKQFGLDASQTQRVVDVLGKTAFSVSADVEQIYEGLKNVGPVAANAGLSLEETNAALGVLHEQAIKGGRSGTQLRGIIARLLKPTKEVEEAVHGLGLNLADVDPTTQGLIGTFEAFARANLNVKDAVKIFGTEQVAGSTAIAGMVDKLKELTEANEKASGTMQRAADIAGNNFVNKIISLGSAFEGLGISIWQSALGPALTLVTEELTKYVRVLNIAFKTVAETIPDLFTKNKSVSLDVADAMLTVQDAWSTLSMWVSKGIAQLEYGFDIFLAHLGDAVQTFVQLLRDVMSEAMYYTMQAPMELMAKTPGVAEAMKGLGLDPAAAAKQYEDVRLRLAGRQRLSDAEVQRLMKEAYSGTGPESEDAMRRLSNYMAGRPLHERQLEDELKRVDDHHKQRMAAIDKAYEEEGAEIQKLQRKIDSARLGKESLGGGAGGKLPADVEAELAGLEAPPAAPDYDKQMQDEAIRMLDDYIDRIKHERETALLSNDERERALHIFELERIAREAGIDDIDATTAAMEKELRTMQRLRKMREFADDIGNAFGQAAADIIMDFKNIEDAAERMLRMLQRIVLEHAIARPIAEGVSKLIVGVGGAVVGAGAGAGATYPEGGPAVFYGLGPAPGVGGARGMVFDSGIVHGMQSGSVFNVPRYFRSGRDRAVIGEGGPEAALPLGRTADGRLGVVVANGGSTSPTVIMNVYTNDADSFRRSNRQILRGLRSAVGRSV